VPIFTQSTFPLLVFIYVARSVFFSIPRAGEGFLLTGIQIISINFDMGSIATSLSVGRRVMAEIKRGALRAMETSNVNVIDL
jgi:hypothetical protein